VREKKMYLVSVQGYMSKETQTNKEMNQTERKRDTGTSIVVSNNATCMSVMDE
jgi:hypothetical protein